jgi:hypothetical protein
MRRCNRTGQTQTPTASAITIESIPHNAIDQSETSVCAVRTHAPVHPLNPRVKPFATSHGAVANIASGPRAAFRVNPIDDARYDIIVPGMPATARGHAEPVTLLAASVQELEAN